MIFFAVVYKIDPLLKMIKLRNRQTVPKISIPKTVVQQSDNIPEKCVSLNILAQPESGPIRADVIFIHGLHGNRFSFIDKLSLFTSVFMR